MNKRICILIWLLLLLLPLANVSHAQELNAKIVINSNQIQGTDATIFENLQKTIQQFINETHWTHLQFKKNERIPCSFNITITKYDPTNNLFTAKALIQATRPVYNAAYTTTFYSNTDNDFNFSFALFDQLNFNEQNIDNQLVALLAYYAYLIIGIDLDTFSPMGGQEVLQKCMNITNNAQNLNFTGWKAFDNDRNRYGIINSYFDSGSPLFRKLQYDYYRNGLDLMVENLDLARSNITQALIQDLKAFHDNKRMSILPQLWTDYKKDELVNIYKHQGNPKEKNDIYDILFSINASQNNYWESIKE